MRARCANSANQIENRCDGRGRDCGFEIRDIPNELCRKYSQRSRQRDEAIERFTKETGRKPTDNEVAVLVRESRGDKLMEISTKEVRERQRERLKPQEARLLADLYPDKKEITVNLESATPSLLYAQDHIFERVSVCRDHEVLTEAPASWPRAYKPR